MEEKTAMEKLGEIQQKIKSSKDQRNDFGGFNYRSAEGIYSAAKPHLKEYGLILVLNDEIHDIGGKIYIVARASLYEKTSIEPFITVNGYAKEADSKKGMSSEQVTGSASSYARKYALGGLFLLDDGTSDPDSLPNGGNNDKIKKQQVANLLKIITDKGYSGDDIGKICKRGLKHNTLEDITVDLYESSIKILEEMPEKVKK